MYVPPKKSADEKAVKQYVSFYPADLKRILAYCQKEDRAISWVVRQAVREWLDKHEQQ